MEKHNFQDLIRFFQFLGPEKIFSCRLSPSFRYGAWDVKAAIQAVKESGEELHVTLNITDLKGTKTNNVIGTRVLCVDDSELLPSAFMLLNPHLAVESSPGKQHYYWKLERGISLEYWSKVQLALAYKFKADKALRQVAHLIRVPGVMRVCKDGSTFTPHIFGGVNGEPLSIEAIGQLFGDIETLYQAGLAEIKEERAVVRAAFKGLKEGKEPAYVNGHAALGRNDALFTLVSEELKDAANQDLSEERVLEFTSKVNEELFTAHPKGVLSAQEVKWISESAFRRWEESREGMMEVLREEPIQLSSAGNGDIAGEDSEVEDLYSEMALVKQVTSIFKKYLFTYGSAFYAFNRKEKVWVVQNIHRRELTEMYAELIEALICSEGFVNKFGVDEHGPNYLKLEAARNRYRGLRIQNLVLSDILKGTYVEKHDENRFDKNPELLFVEGGVLNLTTDEIVAPRAEDYQLSKTRIRYKSSAACPKWITFLGEVFSNNEDPEAMVSFMQELFGYSLSGYMGEQKVFCHLGSGCNGKSKILSALIALGGNYATFIEPERVLKKKNSFQQPFERLGAKIEARRICVIDDMEISTEWNESVIKNLTGHNIIARAEYEKERKIYNVCKFHFGMNEAPRPEGENFGILRRICIVPYARRFEANSYESERIDKLINSELEGILKWSIDGYKRYYKRGSLSYPEETTYAINEYREANFTFDKALEECFEYDETKFMSSEEVYDKVVNHMRFNDKTCDMPKNALCKKVKEKFNCDSRKRVGATTLRGFKLRIK